MPRARCISAWLMRPGRHRPATGRPGVANDSGRRYSQPVVLRRAMQRAAEKVEHRVQGTADEEQVTVAAAGQHRAGASTARPAAPENDSGAAWATTGVGRLVS